MAAEKTTHSHASGDGNAFSWEGKKLTAIQDISMPCNLSLPGAHGQVRFTKLGVICDGVATTRTSLLWYGKSCVAPLLFFLNDGVAVSETTLEFHPTTIHCFGPVIQADATAPLRMVLLPLGSADSQEDLLSAGCAVQYQAASAKTSFNAQWEEIATCFEDHVDFKDASVFNDAIQNGEELCKEILTGVCGLRKCV